MTQLLQRDLTKIVILQQVHLLVQLPKILHWWSFNYDKCFFKSYEARLDLESSNRTIYQRFNPNNYKTSGGPNGIGYSFGTLIDADANDTLKLKFYLSGGSKDADTQSDGSLFMYLVVK